MHRPGVSVKPGRPARFRQAPLGARPRVRTPTRGMFLRPAWRWPSIAHQNHRRRPVRQPNARRRSAARSLGFTARPVDQPARSPRRLGDQSRRDRTRNDSSLRCRRSRGATPPTLVPQHPRRRSVTMVLDIEVVDQVTSKTLWSRTSYSVDGQYDERDEATGRSPRDRQPRASHRRRSAVTMVTRRRGATYDRIVLVAS